MLPETNVTYALQKSLDRAIGQYKANLACNSALKKED